MVERERFVSEKVFQDRFVKKLEEFRWKALDSLDGTKRKVTVDTLIEHWREELNRLNADVLEGVPLTDGEFHQVLAKVNRIDNSYEAAKLLAMEQSTGKIDGIYRDPHPNVTREQLTLTIFKKAHVGGGESSYHIAREVESKHGNRFDLVLLINGLPLINIEQKRSDKSLEEAFQQFKRYYADGEYVNNFMAFSQMMVITSEVATRYFATPKSLSAFNESFVFHWSDANNQPVNDWEEIINQFLMIPMAHQMVGDYLVIEEAKDEDNCRHMLLRPYQVHALQAIEGAALGRGHADGIPHGGFVWHTTGSGKTITSFKTALFLSSRVGFDKVVFLVDRKELDSRTSENFKAYAAYEAVTVDDTPHTHHLKKNLTSSRRGIFVTTTFKLHNLVKEMVAQDDQRLTDKRFVFIIDEAHRTTMGEMMVTIRQYFRKNSLFYGFTGTPLFDENKASGMVNEQSEMIDTTEKLFGPLLHQYTIDEAIRDRNVLGFHVDYINTGEFESYDTLRDRIVDEKLEEQPNVARRTLERDVYQWTELEVEKEAKKRKILVYQDETHIPRVVEEILHNWEHQSQNRFFNAILTVAYKERVIAYYEEFKRQLAEVESPIHVAMTFSFGSSDERERVDSTLIEQMFQDYASFTGIEYVAGDHKNGEAAYYEDLVERATRGGSGRNPKNIDLVIVANQLLTGYDSKFINTLYVDRTLELQGLIQAYSRTNRLYGKEKQFGSIVNFQYPRITESMVDEALVLYGSGGTSSRAIVQPYEEALEAFTEASQSIVDSLSDPASWQLLEGNEEEKEQFVQTFRETSAKLNTLQQYYEFEWDDDVLGMTEDEWMKYVGAFRNLTRDEDSFEEEDIIMPLGQTRLVGSQRIDENYILQLIGDRATTTTEGIQTVDEDILHLIYQKIEELSQLGEYERAQLLKQFVLEEVEAEHVSETERFDEAYTMWKNRKKKEYIYELSEEWAIDEQVFERSVESYSTTYPDDIPYVDELLASTQGAPRERLKKGNLLDHNVLLAEELPDLISKVKRKFE